LTAAALSNTVRFDFWSMHGDRHMNVHDVAIVGSGICGISAAVEVSKKTQNYVILEKTERIAGHEYAVDVDGRKHDIGFLFDDLISPLHVFAIRELHLNFTQHRIVYSSSDASGRVRHCNADDGSEHLDEIRRLYALTERIKLASPQIFVTCEEFLDRNGFSEEFIRYVLKPAISILFLSGNELGMRKPIFVIAIFLQRILSLSTQLRHPMLWSVDGTEQIVHQTVATYDMGSHIVREAGVTGVTKSGDHWRLEVEGGGTYEAKQVIFACDTVEIARICGDLLKSPSPKWRLLSKYIDYANGLFSPCYSVVHRDPSLVPKEMIPRKNEIDFVYHYVYYDDGRWILSGVLEEGVFGSVSLEKSLLDEHISADSVLHRKEWRHPGQDTTVLAAVNTGVLRKRNYDGLHFIGAGMYMIGHTYAFQTGTDTGARVASAVARKNRKRNGRFGSVLGSRRQSR